MVIYVFLLALNLPFFFFFFSVYGNLPSENQLADWEFAIAQHSAVPQGVLVCYSYFLIYQKKKKEYDKVWF